MSTLQQSNTDSFLFDEFFLTKNSKFEFFKILENLRIKRQMKNHESLSTFQFLRSRDSRQIDEFFYRKIQNANGKS